MKKKKSVYEMSLDPEELELERSIERGEWTTVPNIEQERLEASIAAKNYFRAKKEKRISIRVFANDLDTLKKIAAEEGLPYQTLVTSILHKYATGRLKDCKNM